MQRVLDKYTWDATARKYLEAITKIIESDKDLQNISIHKYFKNPKQHNIGLNFITKEFLEKEK